MKKKEEIHEVNVPLRCYECIYVFKECEIVKLIKIKFYKNLVQLDNCIDPMLKNLKTSKI